MGSRSRLLCEQQLHQLAVKKVIETFSKAMDITHPCGKLKRLPKTLIDEGSLCLIGLIQNRCAGRRDFSTAAQCD